MGMEKIVIVTNNVYAEQSFQDKLLVLSHEVYCSKCLLEELPNELITYFDILLLSETIPDQDVNKILSSIKDQNILVVRKSVEQLSTEEKAAWVEKGIAGWLNYTAPIERLRESLDEIIRTNHAPLTRTAIKTTVTRKIKFSKIEYRIICTLLDQEDYFMTRPDLCRHLWNEPPTNSRLVQLSTMVNNIRRKVRLEGIEADAIKTLWNKGYQLSRSLDWQSFYQQA